MDISSIRYHIGASFKVNMAEVGCLYGLARKLSLGQPIM